MEFGLGMVGGVLGGLLFYAGLARKVYNLQVDIVTLQERLLQEKNQRAALTRHRAKDDLEVLQQLQTQPAQPAKINHLAKFGIGRTS